MTGLGMLAVGLGVIMTFSGIKGHNFVTVIQSIVTGEPLDEVGQYTNAEVAADGAIAFTPRSDPTGQTGGGATRGGGTGGAGGGAGAF